MKERNFLVSLTGLEPMHIAYQSIALPTELQTQKKN